MAKVSRKTRVRLRLPKATLRFYQRVSRLARVPVSDCFAVAMAIYVINGRDRKRGRR